MISVVLEGMDGVGKSTLSKTLSDRLDIGTHIIGGRPESDDVATAMSASQVELVKEGNIIFDRLTCISRLCYESQLSTTHAMDLITDMVEIGNHAIVVYCYTRNPQPVDKDYKSAEHVARVKADQLNIHNRYIWCMSMIKSGYVFFNYKVHSVDLLVKFIQRRDHYVN